ncbi:hypothetical protein GCM10010201_06110 [Pilimelia columellifera subsp. columellifera]|uniref:Uncharacterized protein n=2 Tax=Pilimelia TaxID=53370 RepID=A0ABN3N2X6_9ACTN
MIAVVGGTVAVTQVSSANERTRIGSRTGAKAAADTGNRTKASNGRGGQIINGLQVVGRACGGSNLQPHQGFEAGDRCVNTQFGEVSDAPRNPSLLITGSPRAVRVGQAFQLVVSTRNLIRDRFLGAADGGYYLEASFLNGQGLQRGHFHTACRMLNNAKVAQNPDLEPAFFKATEDGRGSARADQVAVAVDGLPNAGLAQCAVWAGDGSHRVPMMERANQVPAFDAIRIQVVN